MPKVRPAVLPQHAIQKDYVGWQEGSKASTSTDFLYNKIAPLFIAQLPEQTNFKYFNKLVYVEPLHNASPEGEAELELLHKLLSPVHLLTIDFETQKAEENSSPVCYANVKGLREGFE